MFFLLFANGVFGRGKKFKGKRLKRKKLSGFLFFISLFGWKENERKWNRKMIIFSYLFVRKIDGKEKYNDV